MNTSEGMRRLATMIRLIGTFIAAFVIWNGYKATPAEWMHISFGITFLLSAMILAWVVDGFGAPPKN